MLDGILKLTFSTFSYLTKNPKGIPQRQDLEKVTFVKELFGYASMKQYQSTKKHLEDI